MKTAHPEDTRLNAASQALSTYLDTLHSLALENLPPSLQGDVFQDLILDTLHLASAQGFNPFTLARLSLDAYSHERPFRARPTLPRMPEECYND
jgi:hypothetical protein